MTVTIVPKFTVTAYYVFLFCTIIMTILMTMTMTTAIAIAVIFLITLIKTMTYALQRAASSHGGTNPPRPALLLARPSECVPQRRFPVQDVAGQQVPYGTNHGNH